MRRLYRVQARTLDSDIDELFTSEKVAKEYITYLRDNNLIGTWSSLGTIWATETLDELVSNGEEFE